MKLQEADRKAARKRENSLWRDLFACLAEITGMRPWDGLDAGAPFAYIQENQEQMIFISCVQEAEDSVGIQVFPSPQDYQRVSSGKATVREEVRRYIELETYDVFFTEQEEVPEEMRKIYRRLSLNFQDGLWPWVIHKQWGCLGTIPEAEELAFLLDCLGNFHMQLRALSLYGGKLNPEFEKGDMLLRYYSPEDRLWFNRVVPFALPQFPPYQIQIRDSSPKLRELKTLPAATDVRRVEFDFGWLDEPVQDKADDVPYFPLVVVLTDRQTGEVLSMYHCRPEDLMDCAFTAWSEMLHAHGIPETLYLCREKSYSLFQDFSQKLGVKLKWVKRLPAAEKVLRDLGAV